MPEPGQLPAVPRVLRAWYVLCTSEELRAGAKPLQRKLYGTPIVLFRGEDGVAGALLDRCPHRSVPLSFGAVRGCNLQCGYHGWEFDPAGKVQRIPALVGEADKPGRRATAYPVREQQGYVWVWGDPAAEPDVEPYHFPYAERAGYTVVRTQVEAAGSLHAVAENALDVPHTGFLHKGLFRADGERNRIRCVLTRSADRAVCEYIGEPRPEGLVARILSPSGGVVTHFDRFILPCITEVEYAIGEENHVVNAAALTPVDEHHTQLYSVFAIRSRLPVGLIKPFVAPMALKIFDQDAVVLELQTETLRRFGELRYVSTEIDLLGPHILKLLTRAASGAAPDPDRGDYRTEIEMDV
ncbi:MAG: aromatic ring-hydroxylating dioxygenase subunit alpha [Alphaproteobacteria bacterium]|nr:aromatic ring-hydroxylating dioxygenase subunit alpha [Alphaproteobacteria bacterium]MCB9793206.1 aromatic ring-hydroxylating dioxygenase subunit alpha [Alphaproteobacteria bacterium]